LSTPEQRRDAKITDERNVYDEPVTMVGSFSAIFALLTRHVALVAVSAVGLAVLVVGFALLQPREYTSTASFVSQSVRSQSSSLGGIAAQFGIAIPGDAGTDSPQFYLDLITSRAILDTVVGTTYDTATDGKTRPTSLLDVFKAKGSDSAQRTVNAEKKLRQHLSGSVGKQTGVVNITISTPDPVLSKLVAQRILTAINAFNLQKRQSRASAERKFTEERLASARSDLLDAENALQHFQQQNRVYNTAPRLSFEQDRLSREVQNRQQIVNVLSESFEQAKIDEVRDTPVITVLDMPETAPAPNPRGLLTKLIFALLFGAVCGALASWVQETRQDSRSKSSLASNV
jgi:uncharacterized protein involved in exopolysaccharide biosynthesis